MSSRLLPFTALRCGAVVCAALALPAAATAQTPYKVVGPDGKVTYTDRPDITSASRISTVGGLTTEAPEPILPFELRQATARYPVTLYVTTDDCPPCRAARELLRQRGIPFAERQVQTPEDAQALERLSGGREAPTLAVGGQILRGLTAETWTAYLDAAGYPRESRLPANYVYPLAVPLVARAPAPAPAAAAADIPVTLPSLPVATGAIRF